MRRRLACGLWLAWALGVGGAAALAVQGAGSAWRGGLLVLALAVSAWGVRACLRSVPAGVLRWTGLHWHWDGAGRGGPAASSPPIAQGPIQVEVAWDLQQAILLRGRVGRASWTSPAAWIWVERPGGMSRAAWLAFRRAVYCPARPEAPVSDEPKFS